MNLELCILAVEQNYFALLHIGKEINILNKVIFNVVKQNINFLKYYIDVITDYEIIHNIAFHNILAQTIKHTHEYVKYVFNSKKIVLDNKLFLFKELLRINPKTILVPCQFTNIFPNKFFSSYECLVMINPYILKYNNLSCLREISVIGINSNILKYIKYQTFKICEIALRHKGYSIRYVNNRTIKLWEIAIGENYKSIKFLEKEDIEILIIAMNKNLRAINYYNFYINEHDSEKLYNIFGKKMFPYIENKKNFPFYSKLMVKMNGLNLQYIEKQTNEICLSSVKENPEALRFVKNQTDEICLEAVKKDGNVIVYVKNKTPEIYYAAMEQNYNSYEFFGKTNKDLNNKYNYERVKQNGLNIQYIDFQSSILCLLAVKNNGLALKYIRIQNKNIILAAVKQNGLALEYAKVEYINKDICFEAVKQNKEAIKFCPKKILHEHPYIYDEVISKIL